MGYYSTIEKNKTDREMMVLENVISRETAQAQMIPQALPQMRTLAFNF